MSLKWIGVFLLALLPAWAQAQDDARRITVLGEGRVEAVPDMATLSLGVVSEARTAREAIDENSGSMAAVLERLRSEGIAETDLQTSNFSVSPRYDHRNSSGENRIIGFVAQNMLSVRVRDLERLGAILDLVADVGANSFQGLRFSLQEPGPVEDAARAAAVAEGRRIAELYAAAGGVTLGALMRLSDVVVAQPGPVMMMQAERMAADGASVPMAAGEVTFTARVTMIYAIE